MKFIVYFLVSLLAFSSCKKSETADEVSTSQAGVMAVKLPPSKDKVSTSGVMDAPQQESLTIEQKIIKEGNLRYETNDLKATYSQIVTAIKKNGASIQNDVEGKNYGSVFRKIIVRVPNKNFDLFVNDISKGVSYFETKEISSQDVTEEYIDIDARLKAKKVLESRYLELLHKANKISEMLEIEGQLSTIREEIEAKEGQLRYMQSRISYSTVTIEFYKNVADSESATISYGSKIWNAIESGFNNISSFILTLLEIWPFLLILGIGTYFFRKRIQNKKNKQ